MIDTVVINLKEDAYRLLAKEHSLPWQLHSKRDGYSKYVKTLTKQQRSDGIYRPRIRGLHRGAQKLIQVELSLPKLLFGNNVDELCDKDFESVLQLLSERLLEQGVIIGPKQLKKCSLSVVHYSKNILLDMYTATSVLTKMSQVKVPGYMDITRDRYMNAGHVVHLYTKAHSLVGYDKLKDIKKPKSRAIDKDQTIQQLSLFKEVPELKQAELLRLEVRLSQKRKMQDVILSKDLKEEVLFEQAFNEQLAMRIMNDYWDNYMQLSLTTFTVCKTPTTILRMLTFHNAPKNAKDAIYLMGLCMLSQSDNGMIEARDIIEKKYSTRTWYRVTEDCKRLNEAVYPHLEGWIGQVRRSLKEYRPLRVKQVPKLLKVLEET